MVLPLLITLAAAAAVYGGMEYAKGFFFDKKLEINNYNCDMFQGRWVYDANYHPLYTSESCPFLSKQFDDCQHNGRPDNDYVKYRWKPTSCTLPRFDGNNLLRRIQGKKIMLVGDSVGYNQWLSLACMISSGVSNATYKHNNTSGALISTIYFPAYNVSLMFSRNDFLVDMVVGGKNERILKLDSIENGGAIWQDVDILVFNTWNQEGLQTGKNQLWDVIEEANTRIKDMDPLVAYEKAIKTWANWVNSTVDTKKSHIFLQGVSPNHYNAKDCKRQTRPIPQHKLYPRDPNPREAVLKKALEGTISKPVHLLNITAMSQPRKDGHPSIYVNGSKGVDCTNWCLPGVPDAWNELLYARLWGYH